MSRMRPGHVDTINIVIMYKNVSVYIEIGPCMAGQMGDRLCHLVFRRFIEPAKSIAEPSCLVSTISDNL